MKKKLKFAILYGSTRKKRLGIRFVKFLEGQVLKNGHTPYIIDPLENVPIILIEFIFFSSSKLKLYSI